MNANEPVTPAQNAADSLERLAREVEGTETGDPMALKGVLAWGWHAVGLLAYLRLQAQRGRFDAWLQDYLNEGKPDLQPERDAYWEERQRLSFLELLDLLSAPALSILKPEFYQGWQDRTSRCQGLRSQVTHLLGGSIGAEQREDLLLLLGAYHRLIRMPAGVSLETAPVWDGIPALLDLAEMLVDTSASEAGVLTRAIDRCRAALT